MNEQTPSLFRVWLCGQFLVERWNGSTYESLSLKAWGGSNDPRRLLKRLLCSPRRQVRRGELLEDLWQEVDPDVSRGYLNDAVYRLRGALSPAKGVKSLLIASDDHSGLAVPGQEMLWVDADAALDVLAQAEAVEQEGSDPLSLVQEAVQLLERGQFLEEEEGLWAHGRRGTVGRARHGCLLWQARLYQQRKSLHQAEMVLNTLLEQDAMDEDALCLLMTNLHLQQRTSEALRLFEQTIHLFHEEGIEVTTSTKELIVRIRQESLPPKNYMLRSFPHESQTQNISEYVDIGQIQRESTEHLPSKVSNQELSPPEPWERLARALANSTALDSKALEEVDQITRTYWGLRRSLGYRNVLPGLLGHLEAIIRLLESSQSPTSCRSLSASASEVAQYIGAIYFDMQNYIPACAYYVVATKSAEEAENATLQATSLGRKSSLFVYSGRPREAVPILERAQQIATHHSPAATLAWLAAIKAEAYAHLHEENACLESLKQSEDLLQHASDKGNQHGIQFDYPKMVGYKGVCFLYLEQANAALELLEEGTKLTGMLSPRQQAIMLTDKAEAYRQQCKIEEACSCALNALEIGNQTKSYLVLHRLHKVLSSMEHWKDLQTVKKFARQMTLKAKVIQSPVLLLEKSTHD